MIIKGVAIEDTFAEAFGMRATRLIITADTAEWAETAGRSLTGFATSVIACGCEAAIERLEPSETPDGRPGITVLIFAINSKELQKQLQLRVGQCVLTTVGSACFSGLDAAEQLKLGGQLRYFGDGFQIAKKIGERRYWRIPVMEGEFLLSETFGMQKKSVAGGNFLILADTQAIALAAAEAATEAIATVPGVILPFPGGVVRSMQLTVRNKDIWRGTNSKILQPYMSAAKFASYENAAWSAAQAENQRGCYDIHP